MRDATRVEHRQRGPERPRPDPASVVDLASAPGRDPAVVGSKAASLARAHHGGLPVLPGFVITTEAVSTLRVSGTGGGAFGIDGSIRQAWSHLTRSGRAECVVRSSSTIEDGSESSMAGRFESVLHVSGWDDFVRAVTLVANSAERPGLGGAPMAVLVQPQAISRFGGVLFGLDPLTGDARRLLVSLVAGSPDEIVSGRSSGTTIRLGRHGRLSSTDGPVPSGFGPRQRWALARLARQAGRVFGQPQDIEWLIEPDGTLRLLQSRPITAAAVPAPRSHVFGPGPVAETFPNQLSVLERDLWLPPLDEGIAEALRISGAARRRLLDRTGSETGWGGRFVIDMDGRVAVDLEAIGARSPTHSRLRALDPRSSLPRLRAAWRMGRLRTAFGPIVDDLIDEVDAHLSAVPRLDRLDDHELSAILTTTSSTLVGLHAHEVLAGLFLDPDTGSVTGASVAIATLARDRLDGIDDAEIIALHPVVLALVPPRIGSPPDGRRLPIGHAGPSEGRSFPVLSPHDGDRSAADVPSTLAVGRESLRLRIRWVHELGAAAAEELGRRLQRRGQLEADGHVRLVPLDHLLAMVEDSSLRTDIDAGPADPGVLPAAFRITHSGSVVAHRSPSTGGSQGVSPGLGRGRVVHQRSAGEREPVVLVVDALDPSLANSLPGLAGLVSETGSPLSHLAILAREQHVPLVVGVAGATRRFEPGDVVVVDGDRGTVEVVEGAVIDHGQTATEEVEP